MKITAQPSLYYWVSFNKKEIELLRVLASNHYDALCKSYAGENGLLTKCQNVMQYNIDIGQTDMAEVQHIFQRNDCDIVAKITEMVHYLPNEKDSLMAMNLHVKFVNACRAFNDHYRDNPAFEVGV